MLAGKTLHRLPGASLERRVYFFVLFLGFRRKTHISGGFRRLSEASSADVCWQGLERSCREGMSRP